MKRRKNLWHFTKYREVASGRRVDYVGWVLMDKVKCSVSAAAARVQLQYSSRTTILTVSRANHRRHPAPRFRPGARTLVDLLLTQLSGTDPQGATGISRYPSDLSLETSEFDRPLWAVEQSARVLPWIYGYSTTAQGKEWPFHFFFDSPFDDIIPLVLYADRDMEIIHLAASPDPAFPEDIERAINEVLLSDTKDMCGAMSLVASRFYSWTKPVTFRTVIVRRANNWMQRISDCLLPNTSFIRILVLDMPFKQNGGRGELPEEELSLIRQLLEACEGVRHLAVTWNIWAHLERECGALRLEGLYLRWDGVACCFPQIFPPALDHLRHPGALEDLTLCAPGDLYSNLRCRFGETYLPPTGQCVNLAYVTYASRQWPGRGVDPTNLKGAMHVLIGRTHLFDFEESRMKEIREYYSNFSIACVRNWDQVLVEWVAKMEGRKSQLSHGTMVVYRTSSWNFGEWRPSHTRCRPLPFV
ncbi:hypothetical protein K438DRAFT_1777439 [Mycena galopus ATCC 62051]|nr:hypothetical protein K438DRAFT_1777439 [Mycena galopus ATCC 62051]